MSKFANDLIESMTDAVAFAEGKSPAAITHVLQLPDKTSPKISQTKKKKARNNRRRMGKRLRHPSFE